MYCMKFTAKGHCENGMNESWKTNEMVDRHSFHAKVDTWCWFLNNSKWRNMVYFQVAYSRRSLWSGHQVVTRPRLPCFTVTSTVRLIVEPLRWVSWHPLPARWPQCYGFDGRQTLLYVDTQDGSRKIKKLTKEKPGPCWTTCCFHSAVNWWTWVTKESLSFLLHTAVHCFSVFSSWDGADNRDKCWEARCPIGHPCLLPS